MKKKPPLNPIALLAFLGIGTATMVGLHFRDAQRRRDAKEWQRYAAERTLEEGSPLYSEIYKAWRSAREYARRIDGEQLAELCRLEKLLESADRVVRVSEGLMKAHECARDPSLTAEVRASVLAYWFYQWNRVFMAWPDSYPQYTEKALYKSALAALKRINSGKSGVVIGYEGHEEGSPFETRPPEPMSKHVGWA